MKKIIFLAALALSALQMLAADVDVNTAQQVAQRFLKSQSATNGRFMASAPAIKWTHAEKTSSKATQAAYYIVNTDNGYVIVAGDDRAKEILAFGEGSLNSINDLPEAVQYFLDIYRKQMDYLLAHPGMMVQKRAATRGVSVDAMLQTTWAQDKPYNMRCPKVGRDYCKVGCTATSLAQVMKYWEYPATAPAMDSYICKDSKINVPALPEYTFDWANMRDTYEGMSNSAIENMADYLVDAIGYLMRYVGQAENIDYNTNRSGCDNPQILQAIRIFGYDEGARIVKKLDSPDTQEELENGDFTLEEYYNDEQWGEAIQAELRAGRPLVYCAYDMSSDSAGIAGHAFNVDGYNADDDTYHVNFGMSSDKNGWFALNAFQADFVTIYDFWPIFFAGVQPPGMTTEPRILVSPDELSMACYTGENTTATFNVVGERLSGNITATLNDANSVFAMDVTDIAVVDSAANVTVTVTYAPQTVGTHNATITLSSDGVESRVVTLKGVATDAPLVVYDPVMQPADSAYINLTSFRADWTDQTATQNVLSYTLEVNEQPVYNYLAAADWSETVEVFQNQASTWETSGLIPEGWTFSGTNLWAEDHFMSFSYATITTNDFTGNDKVTVVVNAKGMYGATDLTVATSKASQTLSVPRGDFVEYTVVLDCNETDHVALTAGSSYVGLLNVTVYAGEVSAPELRTVQEEGDATHRLISGITDRFYTVQNLNAEGTYLYKVKAYYTDGSESEWSNVEMVTLFENGHAYEPGDVNHDKSVDVNDVTMVISYILGTDVDICPICANVNGDDAIDVADVTSIISIILSAQ